MNLLEKLHPRKTLAFLSAIAAALFLQGCASPFGENNRAYIYVAENKTISCLGETFKMSDEVAAFLAEKGATPETVIIIVVQGQIPDFFLKSIVYACGHKGLSQVYIRGNLHANASLSTPGGNSSGKMQNGAMEVKREQKTPFKMKK